LEGVPPAPRGVPQVEVSFDIDANGIVNVSAKDLATGKEQKITITASTNLSSDEVESLVREAGQHAEDDRRRLEEAELRNTGDSLAYQTEKLVKDNADDISDPDKEAAEKAIADVREALDGEDLDELRSAVTALQAASQQLGEQMHAAAAAAAAASSDDEAADGAETDGAGDDAGDDADDEVVDAEFKAADEK
jgi:molecular chaperone DnaK